MSETTAGAGAGGAAPVQDLVLQVKAAPIQGNSLSQVRQELHRIDAYLNRIQGKFTEIGRKPLTRTGTAGFEAQLRSLKQFDTAIEATARKLGVLSKGQEGQFARITAAFRRNNPSLFRTPETAQGIPSMARILAHVEERFARRQEVYDRAFRRTLFGGGAAERGPAVSPRVSEVTQVSLNSDRLVAALDRLTVAVETRGAVLAASPAAASPAAKPGAASPAAPFAGDPTDDRSEAERRSRKLGTGATIVGQPAEAQRRVVQASGNRYSTTVRQILADNQLVETTFDRKGNAKKVVTTTDLAKKAREDFLDKWQGEMGELAKALPKQRRGRSANDLLNLAGAYEKSATQLEAELAAVKGDDRKLLGRAFVRKVNKAITDLRAEAESVLQLAAQAEQTKPSLAAQRRTTLDVLRAYKAADDQDTRRVRSDDRTMAAKQRAKARVEEAAAAVRAAEAEVKAGAARAAQLNFTRQQAQGLMKELEASGYTRGRQNSTTKFVGGGSEEKRTFAYTKDADGRRTVQQFTEIYKNGRLATVQVQTLGSAIKGLNRGVDSGKGFLENTEHVTRWAASVGTLYASLAVARSGLRAFIDLSYEVARLDQVFQKQGGTTAQLADEVLKLAAANGRNSREALQAATSWARLGLSRLQIQEAVRVSLVASNVAELDTLEATKYLQSTMAAYGLQVRQLAGFLAGLNDISNKFNVTNADLLEGISKVANVAKQAGIPLEELRGLIGAAVGTTGQSGANIGNALKSIIVALSNPALQKTLKGEFGLDTFDARTGDLKNFSDLLADLYVRYQELNNAERQSLLFQTAGKTQASKLAGMLDSYIRAQVLAANALLNLNSAEQENAKIKASLKSELTGLVTEFERFALKVGGAGPSQAIGLAAATLRNALTAFQLPGVSTALGVVVGLLGALTARLMLTKDAVDTTGKKLGYLDKSFRQIGERAAGVWNGVGRVIHGVARELEMAGGSMAKLGRGLRVTDLYLRLMQREGAAGVRRGFENFGEAFQLNNRRGVLGRGRQAALGLTQAAVGGAAGAAGVGGRLLLGGALSVGVMLPQLLLGMAAAGAAVWGLDKAMGALGYSTRKADGLLGEFTADLEKAEAAAQAAAIQVRLLDTAARSLSSGKLRAGERENILKSLEDLEMPGGQTGQRTVGPEVIGKLRALGDAALEPTVRGILDPVRRQVIDARNAQMQDVYAANQRRLRELAKEKDGLRNPEERAKKEADYLKAQTEQLQLAEKIRTGGAADDTAEVEHRKLAILERQKLVLQSIAEIYQNLAAVDPVTRFEASVAAAQAELMAARQNEEVATRRVGAFGSLAAAAKQQAEDLRAQAAAIRDGELAQRKIANLAGVGEILTDRAALQRAASLEDKAATLAATGMPTGQSVADLSRAQLEQQAARDAVREAEKKFSEVADPRRRKAAEFSQSVEDAMGDQRTRNQRFGLGDNDSERLLDRRNGLLREKSRLEREGTNDLKTQAALMQTLLDLVEAENQIRERTGTIERDIAQARRDSQREFNRSFLEGDATSRLKQLAAMKAVSLGLTKTAGGYLALGDLTKYLPDEEKPYGRTNELRRERDELGRNPLADEVRNARRNQINQSRRSLLDGAGSDVLGSLAEMGGAAAVSLKSLEQSGRRAAAALEAAAAAADKFARSGRDGAVPVSGPAVANPQAAGRP